MWNHCRLIGLALLVLGCRASRTTSAQPARRPARPPPLRRSRVPRHDAAGERLPWRGARGWTKRSARAGRGPPASLEHEHLHHLRLEIKHVTVAVAPGVSYAAWTFDGGVPGPALHVRQGDTVDFTLVNRSNIPHSMDFHAAEIAPNKYYVNVHPGDSLHYRFVARVPGRSCITAAPRRWRCTSPTACTARSLSTLPRPGRRRRSSSSCRASLLSPQAGNGWRLYAGLGQTAEPGAGPRDLQRPRFPVRRASARRAAG